MAHFIRERVPYLSALEVCSRRGAIQIHVYLYLYVWALSRSLDLTFWPWTSTPASIASYSCHSLRYVTLRTININSLRPSISQIQARTLQTRTYGVQCTTRPASKRAAYRVVLMNCWRTVSLHDDAYCCSRYPFSTHTVAFRLCSVSTLVPPVLGVYWCSLGLSCCGLCQPLHFLVRPTSHQFIQHWKPVFFRIRTFPLVRPPPRKKIPPPPRTFPLRLHKRNSTCSWRQFRVPVRNRVTGIFSL